MTKLTRRSVLKGAGFALGTLAMPTIVQAYGREKHLVIGAGPSGLQRAWEVLSQREKAEVLLVDKQSGFLERRLSPLGPKPVNRDLLRAFIKAGGRLRQAQIVDVDHSRMKATSYFGHGFDFDTVSIHSGMTFKAMDVEGMEAVYDGRILHGWTDQKQAALLWERVTKLPAGATVVIFKPRGTMRFETGPYQRAEIIAAYLAGHKPQSKVILVDASDYETPMETSYEHVRADLLTLQDGYMLTSVGPIHADLMNVIPEQKEVSL